MTGSGRVALGLALASFVLYQANLREISSADTIPNRLLPHELIRHQRLDLDRFFRGWPPEQPLPYWVQRARGHYVSSYPPAPAVLAVPVYLVPVWLGAGGGWVALNALSKLAASLFAAASVGLVYLAARSLSLRLGAAEGGALGAAAVYAVGTTTWAVSSQGLWGHAPAQLGLALALYALLRADAGAASAGLAGLATGLMVACRPPTAPLALLLALYVFRTARRRAAPFVGLLGAAGLVVLAYNLWTFGSPQGGYAEINRTHAQWHGVEDTWTVSLLGGLVGLLASPSRGLLVYSPVLGFALAGLAGALRPGRDALLRHLAVGVATGLGLLGAYTVWWGGHSFGPRLLTDFLPAMVLGIVPVWPAIRRTRIAGATFAAAFALSIGVQAVGAFFYPSPRDVEWNRTPADVDRAHGRLWDWRDPQLVRLLRNGPASPGFRPGP